MTTMTMNQFIKENTMGEGTAFTENGAISYASMGKEILNQFGKAGTARGRDISDVWCDQQKLWTENPLYALRFPFYLRMITRKVKSFDGKATETVQRGQGARDEAFKRLLWIAKFHKDIFEKYIHILPLVGSFKDLWTIMLLDNNKVVSRKHIFSIIGTYLTREDSSDLVKKYLPAIRSDRNLTPQRAKLNHLAKEFAKYLGITNAEYRLLKSSGTAHDFQKLMCGREYDKINWAHIPGKALLNIVSSKFLANHNLEDNYSNWLDTQPVAKFNGYPFELLNTLVKNGNGCYANLMNLPLYVLKTVDKQFDNLIKTGGQDGGALSGNILCALDTSGSMTAKITENVSSYDVCVSLGIYFSELNKGAFHNVVAMFDDTSSLLTLNGTFSEKVNQIMHEESAWGSTDFQSLIDLICETREKHPEIPLSDFPETLLVVSDMQFNPVFGNTSSNYKEAMKKLSRYFPQEYVDKFKIVWWYCTNRTTSDFPSTMDDAGTYMISGFDGSVISFLLGGEGFSGKENKQSPSMEEIIQMALNQEILKDIVLE